MKILAPPQSGSLAGQTASRNRYGQYLRTRAIPVNPDTAFQGVSRSRLATLSSQWSGLSPAIRAAWDAFATENPRQDSLGQTVTLSGAQQYISVNSRALAIGEPFTESPPGAVDFTLGQLADAVANPSAGVDDGVLTGINILVVGEPEPAETLMVIFAGPAQAAGRSFNSNWKLLGGFPLTQFETSGNYRPANATVAAAYLARWGTPPVGSVVPLRIEAWADYRSQPWLRLQVPVEAI